MWWDDTRATSEEEIEAARREVGLTVPVRKMRTCLMCGQEFMSTGPANRRCKRHDQTDTWTHPQEV